MHIIQGAEKVKNLEDVRIDFNFKKSVLFSYSMCVYLQSKKRFASRGGVKEQEKRGWAPKTGGKG